MSDRRAEAFAELDRLDALAVFLPENAYDQRLNAALRSVLERHYPVDIAGNSPWCHTCRHYSPCPDETDVINAVLGATNE